MDLVYIIKSPDGEAAGTECGAYVAHHDIPVTLMGMAGVEPPWELDGRNAWEWATGAEQETRDHATCIFYPWLWCRDDEYVYMTDIDGTREKLYDMRRDPGQLENLAGEERGVCDAMRGLLWKEMDGDPPRYEVMREGHEWYEYPEVHDPTSEASRKILERRRGKK